MNKPHGMSRKDYFNMKQIVREFLGDKFAPVEIGVLKGATKDYCEALGYKSERHDEGYSSRSVSVCAEGKGRYSVIVYDSGRDCDGRIDHENTYIVAKGKKRQRFYMIRNWETNRPQGKFLSNGQFRILSVEKSSQRDYTAESMGY